MSHRRSTLVNRSSCLPWEELLYECLASLEKCGDGKDIDVLWDIVFVICVIYGNMRDMEVKDSKSMRLQLLEKL